MTCHRPDRTSSCTCKGLVLGCCVCQHTLRAHDRRYLQAHCLGPDVLMLNAGLGTAEGLSCS